MSRYTNAERMALTPYEDVTLDVDAEYDFDWESWEKAEQEQAKQDHGRKAEPQD